MFLERGREGKRGRETSMCGCLSCAPYRGPGPQPRHVPCLGIEPAAFQLQASSQPTEPQRPGQNPGLFVWAAGSSGCSAGRLGASEWMDEDTLPNTWCGCDQQARAASTQNAHQEEGTRFQKASPPSTGSWTQSSSPGGPGRPSRSMDVSPWHRAHRLWGEVPARSPLSSVSLDSIFLKILFIYF